MERQGMPENSEPSFKCPNCGNMLGIEKEEMACDVCGKSLSLSENKVLEASNEEY